MNTQMLVAITPAATFEEVYTRCRNGATINLRAERSLLGLPAP